MASQEKCIIVANLKASLESFFFAAKRVAKSALAPLGPASVPCAGVDEDKLRRLEAKLQRVRAVLRNAERLAADGTASECADLWLRELRGIECAVEDILEKVQFEVMRASLVEDFIACDGEEPSKGRARDREVGFLLSHSPLSSVNLKIKNIWEKYREIASDREALRLTPEDGLVQPRLPTRPPTSSLTCGKLYGRESELQQLLDLLLSTDWVGRVFTPVLVVGMAGVGKTAIVQHAWNDQRVRDFFDCSVWIYSGQGVDVLSATKTMVQACGGDTRDITELSLLQGLLVDLVKGKRLLIVLDEVWSIEKAVWELLGGPLRSALRGSKVIVTSRDTEVGVIMGCDHRHQLRLNCLSDATCWLICKSYAFDDQQIEICPRFASAGEEIVKTCKGLPLVAKSFGGLIRCKPREKWWDFLHSDMCNNDELLHEILPVIRLSYDHLPPHLKNCFAYCSLFPKGYIFDKEELICLWMAQGFLQHHERLQPEDVGQMYFDNLLGKHLFQESPFFDFTEGRYEMHDLFHVLAQSVAEKVCTSIDPYKYNKKHDEIQNHESIRHSSVLPSFNESDITIGGQLFHRQDLRTLLVIKRSCHEINGNFLYVKIQYDIFLRLECLRTLDLSNTSISEIPSSIGNLIHLRYLGLKNTKLKRIPESICGLLNLQTLYLNHSHFLAEVPRGIRYLVNLRHLELPVSEYPSISIPSGLELLTGLQTLNAFYVSDNSIEGCGISGLRYLVNLSGELHISGLINVHQVQDAANANMQNKTKLKKLVLKWWNLTARSQLLDVRTSSLVLHKLQPHRNLEELIISGYCGDKFPQWLGEHCFVKLVKVILEGCENCDVLPALGQLPCLKHLVIQQMETIRTIGKEFIGHSSVQTLGFPALETLDIRKMYDLEIWYGVGDGDFPLLRDLNVSGCNKLRELPLFSALVNLRIQSCELLYDLPGLPTLRYLKLEGFDKVVRLPQLPNLPLLQILELSCCKKLASIGQLEHLLALQMLKVTKCPMLQFAQDESVLPCPRLCICLKDVTCSTYVHTHPCFHT